MKKILYLFFCAALISSCSTEEKLFEVENKTSVKLEQMQNRVNCQYTVYVSSEADYIANNLTELRDLISSASVADYSTIYLADQGSFDIASASDSIVITRPLQIVSGRNNEDFSDGATLFSDTSGSKIFAIQSNNVTLSGLKIKGHDTEVGQVSESPAVTSGVSIKGYDNLKVENCEISGWSYAGVALVNSKDNIINNNYIHHNRRWGLGYGVVLHNTQEIPTNALITCNSFEFNRHDIAGSGNRNQGYEASYNIIGEPGIAIHRFDMHGANGGTEEIAGTFIRIHHNQFLSDADFAIRVTGVTEQGIQIHNNTFKHKCESKAIEQRRLTVILNRENWIGINAYSNNYSNIGISDINFNNLFLFKNSNNEITKYSFGNECSCSNSSGIVGHGFNDYSKFLVGNWTGDGTDDMIALTNSGDLLLFPFNYGTFYEQGGGAVIGHGFNNFKELLVGNWTGDGTDDLIAVTNSGEMYLYPFNNGVFGAGVLVGHGFIGYEKFLVGNWTGASDGTDDLLALSDSGEMLLYPFNNNTFYNQGAAVLVGHGFAGYKDFFIGKWNNDGIDDLIGLSDTNELFLFPFNNTFYNQGAAIELGHGFGDFKDFIVARLPNRPNDDLIAIDTSNKLFLYPVQGASTLGTAIQIGCIKEYNLILNGKWMQ